MPILGTRAAESIRLRRLALRRKSTMRQKKKAAQSAARSRAEREKIFFGKKVEKGTRKEYNKRSSKRSKKGEGER